MTIGQKVIGLAHGAVFVSVCIFMLTAENCPPRDPPLIPPADRSVTLCLEYGLQSGYDAFPLGRDHVRLSCSPAEVSLSINDNWIYIPTEGVHDDDPTMLWYIYRYTLRGQDSTQYMYKRHLFGIQYLMWKDTADVWHEDTWALGMTVWGGVLKQEILSFTCVKEIIDQFNYYNIDKAVSGTTAHEIYHSGTQDPVSCGGGIPHSPGVGCVMMDLRESAGILRRFCWNTDFDYTADFCELCMNKLKAAKTRFAEQ